MQVAVISHLGGLERWSSKSNFQMALGHLVLQSADYALYFRRRSEAGDYVLVDNGMLEGTALTTKQLLEAARLVKAQEIVLPDVLGNTTRTLIAIQQALAEIPITSSLRKMAVPQGETMEMWFECYRTIYDTPNIDVIGIPGITDELFAIKGGRLALCLALDTLGFIRTGTEYHLLGMHSHPYDIFAYNELPWIRSIDTQLPVLCGQLGKRFPLAPGQRPVRAWRRPEGCLSYLSRKQVNEDITDLNVATWLYWAQGEWK